MEVVLKMKLIDFTLIFIGLFICIITVTALKNDTLYKNTLDNIMYNNCVDEITYNALKSSFKSVDDKGEPVINKEILGECLLSEMAVLYSDSSIKNYLASNYIIGILVVKGEFFIFENGKWINNLTFSQGEDTSHSKKVMEISAYISDNYGNELLLALNDGEKYKNTISDYSLLCIYQNRAKTIDRNKYGVYFLSGAAIVEN